MANYALFDLETTIDWQLVEDVEDCGRNEFIQVLREEQHRHDTEDVFVPYTYHVPAVIAVGLVSPTTGELTRLGCVRGEPGSEVSREFWTWVENFQSKPTQGTLVSFNGRAFDMPVLELAALRYGIKIPTHCNEKYGNRYRFQDDWHLDAMDWLTGHGATRLRGGLALLSALAGMPPRPVQHSNLEEQPSIEQMERWCRNDVRRLYVVFQRLQFMRGRATSLPGTPELEDER
jgi:predicted PolB exonuclease-like 3'-5' exonuclease